MDDILQTLTHTIGTNSMRPDQLQHIASQVMEEADLDGNLKLSRTEFVRILARVGDFSTKFSFVVQE